MRRLAIRALSVAALCGAAWAQPAHLAFGAFRPDMSPADAIAAAPNLGWEIVRSRDGARVIGASAENALRFADGDWTVKVGDVFGMDFPPTSANYDAYSFDITRTQRVAAPRDCLALTEQLIVALQPTYGDFGQHPAFAHADNTLYAAPLGPFRIAPIASGSKIRDYGLRDGMQDWTTFAEIDERAGVHVMVKGAFFAAGRSCDLRVDIAMSPERAARAAASRAKYAR